MLAYAGQKLPLVDKIVVRIVIEAQPRWLMFEKGQIDTLVFSDGDSIATQVIDNKGNLTSSCRKKEIRLFEVQGISTGFFVINNANPLFKNNPKLRQAMSLAFDRKKYNDVFHNGTYIMAQSIIPPGLAGYDPDYKNPYCGSGIYEKDIEQAKKILADAGYPDGRGLPVITVDTVSDTIGRQQAEFFQDCMKKIGIQIKVVTNTWPELVRKKMTRTTMIHSMAWVADYPDAQNFLQLFSSLGNPTGLGAHFNDAEFNKLYQQAVAMPDSPARTALYKKLNQILGERVPVIFLAHPVGFAVYQRWLENYSRSDFIYGIEQYWDIDLSKK